MRSLTSNDLDVAVTTFSEKPLSEYEDDYSAFGSGFNKSGVAKKPPVAYKEGPLPTISDSVFSLIILVKPQIHNECSKTFKVKHTCWDSRYM